MNLGNKSEPAGEERPLHVGGPNVGDRNVFDRLVDGIFERRWFTNHGEVLQTFERLLTHHLGVKHCIPVCNATVGLQIVCNALELTGEIILPAFTFVATAHSVSWSKLKPVFADVNQDTHCLCPESVRSLITDRTSAIMGVHLWGAPCYPTQLQALADDHDLRLIFDAAHAFHNRHRGTSFGNFGDCEVFSFHATKFFNTFEGGAITTNDDELALRIRRMCNFGYRGPDDIACVGTNAKMSEINAAMGVSMFECIGEIANTNEENFQVYDAFLGGVPGLKLYSLADIDRSNWQYVVLEVDEQTVGCSRDTIVDALVSRNVFAKRYFFPGCHKMPPYREAFSVEERELPNTDRLCQRLICLPTGTAISIDEIHRVCEIILNMCTTRRMRLRPSRQRNRKVAVK